MLINGRSHAAKRASIHNWAMHACVSREDRSMLRFAMLQIRWRVSYKGCIVYRRAPVAAEDTFPVYVQRALTIFSEC